MRRRAIVAIAVLALGAGTAWAVQQQDHGQHQHSPYAGQEASEIPSLTAEELAQLRSGEGMGFAKAAELNHFPGPLHVLELADPLELTTDQRSATEAIFEEMRSAARDLGEQIVEAERHLNLRFRNGHIDRAALDEATNAIAGLYGKLRFTHLEAHLRVTALLQPEQVEAYDRLRGYAGADG